ncbi:thermonuclease family protein [Candidatus Falkowbacteria bacterium]|nr:thermonuclease family protein [Candidatus Falkowbacteria bacterium]
MKKIFYSTIFSAAVLGLAGCASRDINIIPPPVNVAAENEAVNEPAKSPSNPPLESGESANTNTNTKTETETEPSADLFLVSSVVDGDTVKVNIDGTVETLRLIGIDTPETVDPRKPVQCFGVEASNKAKELLTGAKVRLEADPTQGESDVYGRLLRYVFLDDGTNFNKLMIEQGYAFEYTYNTPYKYQTEFKQAETYARENKLGLWADDTCAGVADPVSADTNTNTNTSIGAPEGCVIKGNISTEKIYHLPGCGSYDKTVIDESAGERWFCTEEEAVAAGWRKALNCP